MRMQRDIPANAEWRIIAEVIGEILDLITNARVKNLETIWFDVEAE